jgi:hypothetical protein
MSQCCHKRAIRNFTFYCVEQTGHQCPHEYKVLISDFENVANELTRAETRIGALEAIVRIADVMRDDLMWRDHEPICLAYDDARAALGDKP